MKRERNTFKTRKGEQNIFRTITAGRINFLFIFITDFLFILSSYPSYIVEVFMRKKFGERYFTIANALLISLAMIWVWFLVGSQGQEFLGFTWFLFVLIFLGKSIKHRMEIKKFGTTYNFDRFSYCDGEILPFWWNIINTEILGIKITRYRIHILLEPALPILAGLFLMLIPFTRAIGILIFISGLSFGFRNFMKSTMARNYVLDIIDEQITMEGKHDILVEGKSMSETKGLSFPIELPKSVELREELSNSIGNYNPLDVWDNEHTPNGIDVANSEKQGSFQS